MGPDGDEETPYDAIRDGSLERFQRLTEHGTSIAHSMDELANLLYTAIAYKEIEIAQLLLTLGADVQTRRWNDLTPLQYNLSEYNPYDKKKAPVITRVLVEHGADIHVTDRWKRTPLHQALIASDKVTAKFLIENGADVNAICERGLIHYERLTPLHLAVNCGSMSLIRLLVERGANVRAVTDTKATVLHRFSPFYLNADVVSFLLDQGADVNAIATGGLPPLSCFIRCLTQVKDTQTRVNTRDVRDRIARIIGAIELLLARGANPLAGTPRKCPLAVAVEGNHEDVVRKLCGYLPSGSLARFNVALLEAAVKMDAADALRLLIPFGVRPQGPYAGNKKTPLHLAAANGAIELLRLCLDLGADANVRDNRGNTPLHLAADKDLPNICQLLINYGADRQMINSHGQTPRQVAQAKNRRKVIALL